VRQGDFERLWNDHAQALYGFLVYRTGDRALAEDLVADAFERAYRARRGFDRRKGRDTTWLYSIALNCLRDHVRREGAAGRAFERQTALMAAVPERDHFAAIEERDELTAALERLAPEEREAVALRYGADLTAKQIATVLGTSLTTAEGRIYRALRKLRAQLA
jgi:RNA polymerase sigma factor (sigma-70 family)